ncbi:DUF1513 domain-containing protein [Bauldia litoralis]|uniref:DUF1513 domain-containing protein n=1 Tax=Bauldia litoralis TaxID=665467 RepID=UPI003264F457
MAIDRRNFLKAITALGVMPIATLARADGAPAFVAARMKGNADFSVAVLDHAGTVLFSESIDGRAHDIAIAPDRSTAVVFARRPGFFALVIDLAGRRRVATFAPPEGRHFYGHGFFSADGRLLYATENDYEAERGVLGVYDVAAGYRRTGELSTQGIGPHEALLMRDGRTIAIGNGGVATHPDYDRMKLNLPTMEPSLVYLDAATGDLVDKVMLPASLHQLSIRHMAEAANGTIWFGGQYEGSQTDAVDLVGTHRPGSDPQLIAAPSTAYEGMRQYVGAVAVNDAGTRVAATSPVGGHVVIFDAETRGFVESRAIADVCGIAPDGRDFFISDGRGRLWQGPNLISEAPDLAWDNHVRNIG